MRVMLRVAYDGTAYSGWQIQPNAVTIEQKLLEALSELLGGPVEIIGASRTDAGVHSLGNVAVVDADTRIPAEKFAFALNTRLPEDIRIVGQKDGLNAYRREMNTILLENLKSGNNSIKRDKILTVAINDKDAKHAAINFNSIDDQIIRKVKKVTDRETKPMTTQERVSLLYNI